eukprot:COSAG05_NODE_2530_length_2940_cov_1.928220_1_plen_87_part_00
MSTHSPPHVWWKLTFTPPPCPACPSANAPLHTRRPTQTFSGNFEMFLCRGEDRFCHNPVGRPPDIGYDGIPRHGGGSHSSEFHGTS